MRRPIHGKWPKVAALAAPASSLAWYAARRRMDPVARWRWAALPVLLWHQVEEWVWPGGFIEWLNREVMGSAEDLAPLTPARAATVNVKLGWSMSLATSLLAGRVPAIAIFTSASNAANSALHLAWAGRHRRLDPGAVTAALLLLPWSVAGLRRWVGPGRAPRWQQAVGLAAGAGGFLGMLGRIRGERRKGTGAIIQSV
jgi:Protein of unknown function with HXXEE motif